MLENGGNDGGGREGWTNEQGLDEEVSLDRLFTAGVPKTHGATPLLQMALSAGRRPSCWLCIPLHFADGRGRR